MVGIGCGGRGGSGGLLGAGLAGGSGPRPAIGSPSTSAVGSSVVPVAGSATGSSPADSESPSPAAAANRGSVLPWGGTCRRCRYRASHSAGRPHRPTPEHLVPPVRASARRPARHQQVPGDRVELPQMPVGEAAQPRPDRARRSRRPQQPPGRAGAEHTQVFDAVRPGEHPHHHGGDLRVAVGPHRPWQPQPPSDHPRHPEALPPRRGRQQPRVRHQIRVVEAHRDPAQRRRCSHRRRRPPLRDDVAYQQDQTASSAGHLPLRAPSHRRFVRFCRPAE